MRYCLLLTAYCLVLCFSPGCVYRSLTIRTEPKGALVYLNDRLLGESPITHNFLWYGSYRVIVRKAGYERLEQTRLLKAPFYLWIPLDLVMEVLPLRISDYHTWEFALKPIEEVPQIEAPEAPEAPLSAAPAQAVPAAAPKAEAEKAPASQDRSQILLNTLESEQAKTREESHADDAR